MSLCVSACFTNPETALGACARACRCVPRRVGASREHRAEGHGLHQHLEPALHRGGPRGQPLRHLHTLRHLWRRRTRAARACSRGRTRRCVARSLTSPHTAKPSDQPVSPAGGPARAHACAGVRATRPSPVLSRLVLSPRLMKNSLLPESVASLQQQQQQPERAGERPMGQRTRKNSSAPKSVQDEEADQRASVTVPLLFFRLYSSGTLPRSAGKGRVLPSYRAPVRRAPCPKRAQ